MSEAALKTPARKPRPKYLSLQALLFEIRLPLPGWVSILHRVSGALLFVALVWLLWMLDRSLSSEAAFERIKHYAGLVPVKLSLLVLVWAYCHHFCAGIRYLFLDLDKGVDKETARLTQLDRAGREPRAHRAAGLEAVVNRVVTGAHYGLRDWLAQRITAVIMAVYSVIAVVVLLTGKPITLRRLARPVRAGLDAGRDAAVRREPRLARLGRDARHPDGLHQA